MGQQLLVCFADPDVLARNSIVMVQYPENPTDTLKLRIPDQSNGPKNEPWRKVIPATLLDSIINWYHQILSHIGMTRLYNTILVHFYHKTLKNRIETFIQLCDTCQYNKLPGIGYGHLPPHNALIAPWFEVAIYLVVPWQVTIDSQVLSFQALTCIDTVTDLAEVIQINNISSNLISTLFENNWLAQSP